MLFHFCDVKCFLDMNNTFVLIFFRYLYQLHFYNLYFDEYLTIAWRVDWFFAQYGS